jgi:hypothetical protein
MLPCFSLPLPSEIIQGLLKNAKETMLKIPQYLDSVPMLTTLPLLKFSVEEIKNLSSDEIDKITNILQVNKRIESVRGILIPQHILSPRPSDYPEDTATIPYIVFQQSDSSRKYELIFRGNLALKQHFSRRGSKVIQFVNEYFVVAFGIGKITNSGYWLMLLLKYHTQIDYNYSIEYNQKTNEFKYYKLSDHTPGGPERVESVGFHAKAQWSENNRISKEEFFQFLSHVQENMKKYRGIFTTLLSRMIPIPQLVDIIIDYII